MNPALSKLRLESPRLNKRRFERARLSAAPKKQIKHAGFSP